MSAISLTSRRTISRLMNSVSTLLVTGVFWLAVSALFSFRLIASEGLQVSALTLWALTIGQFLPILFAFLAMDTWSDERQTGRIDLLLSIAVPEHDYVLGKVLGVWLNGALAMAVSLTLVGVELGVFAPTALTDFRAMPLLSSILILLLQNTLWSAASVMASSFFRRPFASFLLATLLLSVIPRVGWQLLLVCAPQGASAWGEMLFDAQVVDFSSGLFSLAEFLVYPIFAGAAILITTLSVKLLRLSGRTSSSSRAGAIFAMILSLACAVLLARFLYRVDLVLEAPVQEAKVVSPRMRQIFSETSGDLSVTAFLSRKDPSFRLVARHLRALKHHADASLGLSVHLHFVDPAWDLANAERLVRRGACENSVVFEKGRRLVALPVGEGLEDRAVASAIQSLVLPPRHQDIYWTIGHGELTFDSYGTWGLSDIARDLVRNGYRNQTIDLAGGQPIPSDCALIVIAGAQDGFSRAEQVRLDTYLKSGGRLLVLLNASGENAVSSLLSTWGVRTLSQPVVGVPTLTGSDVIVSDFADHPLSASLRGFRLVLGNPVSLMPSASISRGEGADHLDFTSIAKAGASAVVALVERGGSVGDDLAIRPTRLIVVGDTSFVMNGQLLARAHSNRDFFLNAIAYLSGTDAIIASDQNANVLSLGLDRDDRLRVSIFVAFSPLAPFFAFLLGALYRRRRL